MLVPRAKRAEKNLKHFYLENPKDFKGKFLKNNFSKILEIFVLKFSENFSQNFGRDFPEISAAWRAAFSARNRRKVAGRVGPGSARKTR